MHGYLARANHRQSHDLLVIIEGGGRTGLEGDKLRCRRRRPLENLQRSRLSGLVGGEIERAKLGPKVSKLTPWPSPTQYNGFQLKQAEFAARARVPILAAQFGGCCCWPAGWLAGYHGQAGETCLVLVSVCGRH